MSLMTASVAASPLTAAMPARTMERTANFMVFIESCTRLLSAWAIKKKKLQTWVGVVSVGGLNECRAVHGPYTERNGRSRTTSHFRKRTEKKKKNKGGGGGMRRR